MSPVSLPTISGTLAHQPTSHEAPLAAFAAVTLADPNAGIDDVLTITLSGAGGYLVESAAYTGFAILEKSGAAYTLRGTAGQIQTALQSLQFVSNAGTAAAPALTNIGLTLSSTLDGVVIASATDTATSVTDSDPVQPPVFGLAATSVTTIWRQAVKPFYGASLVNPNPGTTQTLTITLSGAGGTLALAGGAALPETNQTYSFTGDDSALAADLNQLVFTPNTGGVGSSPTTTFALTDTVSNGAVATATTQVVADDFVLSGSGFGISVPSSATDAFQRPFFPFAGGTLANLYPGVTVVSIALSGASGNLADTGGPVPLVFSGGVYSLTGTEAQVASALDDLIFTPRLIAQNTTATATFDFTLTAAGYGTARTSEILTISAKPSASIAWSLPPGQNPVFQTYWRGLVTPFAAASVIDTNPYGATETLNIVVAGAGALADGANYQGVSSLTLYGPGDYRLTGSVGQVNAELQALQFTPDANPAGATTETTFLLTDVSDDSMGNSGMSAQDSRAHIFDITPTTLPAFAVTALYQNVTLTSLGEQASTAVTLAGTNDPTNPSSLIGVYAGLQQLGATNASPSGAWSLAFNLPNATTTLSARPDGGVGVGFAVAAAPASGVSFGVALGQGPIDVVGVDNAGDVVGDYAVDAQGDTGVYLIRNGAASGVVSPVGDVSVKALGIDANGDLLAQGVANGAYQTLFEYAAAGTYRIIADAMGLGIDAAGDVVFAKASNHGLYELRAGAAQPVALPVAVSGGATFSVDSAGDVFGNGDEVLFAGAASVTKLTATSVIAGVGNGYVWGGGSGGAFVYNNATAQYAFVAPPGATVTTITGVTGAGEVVGYYQTLASGVDDFAFAEQGGVYTTFTPPGAVTAKFTGVAASGALVGQYADATGVAHGFLDQNGVVQSFSVAAPAGMLTPTPISTISASGQQFAGAAGNVVFDETLSAACYGRGTRLRAERGEVAIEDLAVGDRLMVASGGFRPVVWLGRRRLDIKRHPRPDEVRPVRVCAGAFGPGLPGADLRLSPGHNLAFDDALIPVSALVNGITIAREADEKVEYWHVELDAHDVIFAEGLRAESYLDTGNRAAFENGAAYVEAHPDFAPKHWTQACLPLVFDGPAVTVAKARLRLRLQEQGWRLDEDADPHVVVDGLRIEPIRLSQTRLAFALPPGGREIALRSRVFVPAHTLPESADLRRLGLCVGALEIDGRALALERDEVCASGWQDWEIDAGGFSHRWTNGQTPLPPGARMVVVDLAGSGRYWRRAEGGVEAQRLESALAL